MPGPSTSAPARAPLPAHLRHQQGSPENTWLLDPRWERARACDLPALAAKHRQVVIVTAHQHDDLLALGASTGDLAAAGLRVHRLSASRLGRQIDADTLVLAPWPGDGEPQHAEAGRRAERVARAVGAAILFYPISAWERLGAENVPWDALLVLSPSSDALERKRALLAALPGSRPAGAATNPARRVIEVLIDTPSARWNLRGGLAIGDVRSALPVRERRTELLDNVASLSEQPRAAREYAAHRAHVVHSLLGGRRFGHALEAGLVSGQLMGRLARTCDRLTGFDASGREPLSVRGMLHGTPITWCQGQFPRDLPDTPADLIVVSEIGTWLSGGELVLALAQLRRLLSPGGLLVLAHRRRPGLELPLTADLVHEHALGALDLQHVAERREDVLRVDAWRLRSSRDS